ncbi:MAG: glycosyltransferase [Thiolinea sp.]
MKKPHNPGPTIRISLMLGSLLYLALCLAGGLELSYALQSVLVHIFILLASILVIRHVFLLLSAWVETSLPPAMWPRKDDWPPMVSIIIPAYNEEEVIEAAMLSLLAVEYDNYEIIMVDDGSTDNTVPLVRHIIRHHNPRQIPVRIIAQSNGGKANALNTGLIHASGEFVLCVDSDSRIARDSLHKGLRHFRNPRIAAVAGNIVVANERGLLTGFQQLEYMISQNFIRRGLSLFGMVTVIPGPVGLFRKSALCGVHGYDENKQLFAEDADVTVRLLAQGWHITSDEGMQAVTEAPATINGLLRQRYRWKRGIYQVLHNNFFSLITAPDSRRPLIATVLVLEGFLFEVLGFGVTLFMLSNIILLGEIKLLLGWLALLFMLDMLTLMFVVRPGQFLKYLPLLILQKLTYTFALQTWGVLALLDEWRSSAMTWDKIERTGALQEVLT